MVSKRKLEESELAVNFLNYFWVSGGGKFLIVYFYFSNLVSFTLNYIWKSFNKVTLNFSVFLVNTKH